MGGQVLVDGVGPVGIPIDVVGDWGAKEQAISQALGAFAVRLPATPSARGRTVQISLAMVRETFVVL